MKLLIPALLLATGSGTGSLPTPQQIEDAYQQAVASDLESVDNPLLKAAVMHFEVKRIYGCQPDGDDLRCLVDVAGGMKIHNVAMALSLKPGASGWTLIPPSSDGRKQFPAPSPQQLRELLRASAQQRLAAGEHDPQLDAAAGPLSVERSGPCKLQSSIQSSPDTPDTRSTALRCEAELKPTPDSGIVKTTLDLMPDGAGWRLGPDVSEL